MTFRYKCERFRPIEPRQGQAHTQMHTGTQTCRQTCTQDAWGLGDRHTGTDTHTRTDTGEACETHRHGITSHMQTHGLGQTQTSPGWHAMPRIAPHSQVRGQRGGHTAVSRLASLEWTRALLSRNKMPRPYCVPYMPTVLHASHRHQLLHHHHTWSWLSASPLCRQAH